jgi:hypothetical protein
VLPHFAAAGRPSGPRPGEAWSGRDGLGEGRPESGKTASLHYAKDLPGISETIPVLRPPPAVLRHGPHAVSRLRVISYNYALC